MQAVSDLLREAEVLDAKDELKHFRDDFALPSGKIYLCGNSLGPMPKQLFTRLPQELNKWAEQGVEGHFTEPNPWVSVNETCVQSMARLVGAEPSEIAIMNSLTVNLHLLLTSFYTPSEHKRRILMERNAFPSDLYCIDSHVKSRGLDSKQVVWLCDSVLEVLETEDCSEVALCFVGGVNYQTGELYDMERIALLCQSKQITFGVDLAHAAGNVPLHLHAWGVDFAAWCTYKYLNSGPGGIACAFVHDKHASRNNLHRLEGWWGNRSDTRFAMRSEFEPAHGASAWQLSNPPVLQIVALRTSLDVFDHIKLDKMFAKSRELQAFMDRALHTMLPTNTWATLTPTKWRGCQLSLVFPDQVPVRQVFDKLGERGIICDFREPNIIRVAANPVYNSFLDVARFAVGLREVIDALLKSKL